MTPDQARAAHLFADLARIRDRAYARLVAEHGPDEAARLWQAACTGSRPTPSASAPGTKHRQTTQRGIVADARFVPAAGAELDTAPEFLPPCDAGGSESTLPPARRHNM